MLVSVPMGVDLQTRYSLFDSHQKGNVFVRSTGKEFQIVLLDNGLYKEYDDNFRWERLTRSLAVSITPTCG